MTDHAENVILAKDQMLAAMPRRISVAETKEP